MLGANIQNIVFKSIKIHYILCLPFSIFNTPAGSNPGGASIEQPPIKGGCFFLCIIRHRRNNVARLMLTHRKKTDRYDPPNIIVIGTIRRLPNRISRLVAGLNSVPPILRRSRERRFRRVLSYERGAGWYPSLLY